VLDVMSLLREQSVRFDPQLVRVAAHENIEHDGAMVDAFRIETKHATAWADAAGRVLLQRVELPLLGVWEMRDEPFDANARQRFRRQISERGFSAGNPPSGFGRDIDETGQVRFVQADHRIDRAGDRIR
jgi:hypothetical protein